jgi:hypothetical protein
MSDDKDLSAFERETKRMFDESVAGLDAATRSRLTRARYRALEELKPNRTRAWRFTLVPAGTLAAAALVAVLVFQPRHDPGLQAVDSLGDLEILLAEEDLEMLDEDLDFYGWLEEQPEFANGGDGIG